MIELFTNRNRHEQKTNGGTLKPIGKSEIICGFVTVH